VNLRRPDHSPAAAAGDDRSAYLGHLSRHIRRHAALGPVLLLGPPLICSAAAVHELLYNRADVLDWLLAAAVVWPLVLRRRAPVGVFWCCWAVAMATWALGTLSFAEFAVLVALYTVAADRGLRCSLSAAAAVLLGCVLMALRFGPPGSVNDVVVVLSGLGAAAFFLGTTVRAQRRYLVSIEDRAHRLERERAQQAQLAATTERARIAREMHDIVAHGLVVTVALAEAAAATTATDPDGARDKMLQAASTGRQSLAGMRRLLGVLRTDSGTERAPQPSLDTLPTLVDEVRRTGLEVRLAETGTRAPLNEQAETTLYRIVQEALTNVVKHAQDASTVDIALTWESHAVGFGIRDDGTPPSRTVGAESAGNGLAGMKERVAMFGGELYAGATPYGWAVTGSLGLGEPR
jgi:signal transduction histidine kinase